MSAEVNRRMFVASIAAGLPVLAGAAYGPAAASPLDQAHDQAAGAGAVDTVLDHVVREVAAIYNRGQQRGFTGEDARAIAAQLRTAVVRGTQIGIDAPAKNALANLIGARGRNAVLSLEIDKYGAKALLRRYGIEADDRWFASGALDDRTRNKALDALATGGVTGVLKHAADVVEKMAITLDRVPSTRPLRASSLGMQFDFNWYPFCWPMLLEIQVLQMQAAAICAASSWYGGLEVACAGLQATISVMYAMYFAFCT